MRLTYISHSGAAWDITEVLQSVVWSGDYQQAARKAEVTLLWNETDPAFPREIIGNIDNGEMLILYDDNGAELIRGYVFSLRKALNSTERSYTAYDGLIYLLKSSVAHNFQNTTAQGITRQVAAELNIPVDALPDDLGVSLSFAHIAKPAYEAVMGAWTHVKKASGMRYLPVMKAGKLGIAVIGDIVAGRILTPSTDLVAGEVTSSIDGAVTRVLVVDNKGKALAAVENTQMRMLYGIMQTTVQKESGLSADAQARDLLKGSDDQISLSEIIGGPDALDLVTGNAVLVEDPTTGLHGKFQIINDSHTFSDGLHKVSLGLSFEGMMDEVEVELVKAKKKKGPENEEISWKGAEEYGGT